VFVWIFHRVSGILLIFLLASQVITGFFRESSGNQELVDTLIDLHRHPAMNCLLVFLVIFHALYGVRTIMMDLGVKREKLLFWVCTLVGLVLFVVFLAYFFVVYLPSLAST